MLIVDGFCFAAPLLYIHIVVVGTGSCHESPHSALVGVPAKVALHKALQTSGLYAVGGIAVKLQHRVVGFVGGIAWHRML